MSTVRSTNSDDDPVKPPAKRAKTAESDNAGAHSAELAADPLLLNNTEIWVEIFSFLGPGHFIYVAGTCKPFKNSYQLYFSTIGKDDLPTVRPNLVIDNDGNSPVVVDCRRKATVSDTFFRFAFSSVYLANHWSNTTTGRRIDRNCVCFTVARYGNLDVLKWAHEQQGYPCHNLPLTWANAAEGGHMEILEYLQKNSSHPGSRPHRDCREAAAMAAARSGQLDALKWACPNIHHHGFGQYGKLLCLSAAEGGQMIVLNWLLDMGCPWDEDTCRGAAAYGYLDLLKWAREKGCPWDRLTCTWAAWGGHKEILQFAHNNDCPWDEDACASAAQEGRLECLQYLHDNGCPWDVHTCIVAARNGHLAVLQYARINGCPWDARTCSGAAENGQLECLKYAHDNGCPWDERTCLRALANGHLMVARWAHSHGCPWRNPR